MQLIIFGAPGVGKGTQAKIIASKLNIPHISTGDILRAAIAAGTEIGKKAKAIVESGELVPDDVMAVIIKDRLAQDDCSNGFILDGFPRTADQAELLDNVFNSMDKNNIIVIKLDIDAQIIVDRLSSRRTCTSCKNITNLLELEDKEKCPHCGEFGTLMKRDDDQEEVIKNRLQVYENQTAPVLGFYEDKAEILKVDASKSIDDVNNKIMEELSKK